MKDATTDSAKMDSAKSIAAMPFEAAMKRLEEIVAQLEQGDISLEASIAAYETGELLKKRCEDLLKQAETRIEKIRLSGDGKPVGTTPLDVE